MNKSEDMALADNTLPHDAVVLYVRCFRRFMSYQTGDTFISMPRMADALSFEPSPRSKEKPTRPTPRRIRTLISHLERVGLIRKVQSGSITSGLAATYRCSLATVDNSTKDRHDTDTVSRHEERHAQRHGENQQYQGMQPQQRHDESPSQRHGSDTPHRQISVTTDLDDDDHRLITRNEMEWSEDLKNIAASVGLNLSDKLLKAKFVYWKSSQKYTAHEAVYSHKKKWRSYCAALQVKAVERSESQNNQQQAKHNDRPTNRTAALLRQARKASDESY